jgi:uncharacterized protein (TIGR01319 family)
VNATALLADFGSTYTKLRLVDLESGRLLAAAAAPTTARTRLLDGYHEARTRLGPEWAGAEPSVQRACSSAAGGLRMVAIGLVRSLTVEAARRAALGAGARVVGAYAGVLTRTEQAEVQATDPDVVLLAGGFDGGNATALLDNAAALAAGAARPVVVVAGNKSAADDAAAYLTGAGIEAVVCENVLPELGVLNEAPCREAIREVFMRRIVSARGLDAAVELSGQVLMPTPLAVLRGAEILARGANGAPGWGELVVVDVGGATTDVHSLAEGSPRRADLAPAGMPEPFAKRTVEGDLGLRVNAGAVAELVAADPALAPGLDDAQRRELAAYADKVAGDPAFVPGDEAGRRFDVELARVATAVAVRRHAGRVETMYTLSGPVQVQHGKDLGTVGAVVGTGAVFGDPAAARTILGAAVGGTGAGTTALLPEHPRLLADSGYVLAAAGLLADAAPAAALGLLHANLRPV